MADSNISPDRQDFAVHSLEIAAILGHLGFPLVKIALRSKDGMAAFIFPASVAPEVELIKASIEQLRTDVHRVRHAEVERMEAVKQRRERQQPQDAMPNWIKISDLVNPLPPETERPA